MQKKLTYIVSDINKAIAFEWIVEHLNKEDLALSFVLINSKGSCLEQFLTKKNLPVYSITNLGKRFYIFSIWRVARFLKKSKTEIIHCHLRDANIIGLMAGKLVGIKKRIYTRHHSTYHHQYFPNTVKIDKLMNFLATDIVAISKNVEQVLIKKEGVPPNKIHLIHHGFDLNKFKTKNNQNINQLRLKYNTKEKTPIIGVIGRYIDWKGHKYIILAFKKLLIIYPKALFVFANASGPDFSIIKKQIYTSLPKENIIEIEFESDLFSLYHLFDVYVHVPINATIEAFGQTYVESLAAGIPSIFTLSGVAPEFVQDRENALVVPFEDSESIYKGLMELLENNDLVNKLKNRMPISVEPFSLNIFINKLESLYQ